MSVNFSQHLGDDAFNSLAARIRETKVKADDGVTLAQIR